MWLDTRSAAIDPIAVKEYLQFGYVSAPRSIFADVRVVEPGTIVSFDMALRSSVHRYWSLSGLFDSENGGAASGNWRD